MSSAVALLALIQLAGADTAARPSAGCARDAIATGRRLERSLEQQYCIDRRRIYATGFSNGAFFSALLACTLAERIAAVAPVSGGPLRVTCKPSRAVPILIQHGRQDGLIPVGSARRARDDWLKVDGCDRGRKQPDGAACERYETCRDGGVVEYCEEDYAHTWPPQATQRIWEFLAAHPMP